MNEPSVGLRSLACSLGAGGGLAEVRVKGQQQGIGMLGSEVGGHSPHCGQVRLLWQGNTQPVLAHFTPVFSGFYAALGFICFPPLGPKCNLKKTKNRF